MLREYVSVTTAATLLAVWGANMPLTRYADVFSYGDGLRPQRLSRRRAEASLPASSILSRPVEVMHEALGIKGLVGFGMGFGMLAAALRGAGRRTAGRRVSMKAAGLEVAQKTEGKLLKYFENVPRTIVDKKTLDKLLSGYPRDQWEDPPEDSYLYTLKCFAEAYGEGKATKMGWWDFWYMRINMVEADEFASGEEMREEVEYFKKIQNGSFPMWVPGPSGLFYTGAWLQWRGKEPFAGDQCQTPVTNGSFATQFLDNLAFYREGLKPWQRGIEIGMAHGYFIIGPFVALGPLRNTPEAATVGLLAGAALIGIVSVGGLLFGATVKPKRFDRPGDAPAAGFQEMINWHAIGGLGGAGFAHALITVFGS